MGMGELRVGWKEQVRKWALVENGTGETDQGKGEEMV